MGNDVKDAGRRLSQNLNAVQNVIDTPTRLVTEAVGLGDPVGALNAGLSRMVMEGYNEIIGANFDRQKAWEQKVANDAEAQAARERQDEINSMERSDRAASRMARSMGGVFGAGRGRGASYDSAFGVDADFLGV